MIAEEFTKLFENEGVELQTIDHKQVNKETVGEQALYKIRTKELALLMQNISWDDRYEWLNYQKNKGNRLFYQQQYDRAIQVYTEMSVALVFNDTPEHDEMMKQDFQYPIVFNLALCYRKKKDYQKAQMFYDMGIKLNPTPLYILKRGYFHLEIQEYEKAQTDLSLVTNISEHPDLLDDYYNLKQSLNENMKKERETYQKMFQQEEETIPIQLSKFDKLYEWCKGLFLQVFNCRGLFEDDDESDDDQDPKKFLENK